MIRLFYILLFFLNCIASAHAAINPIVRVSIEKGTVSDSFDIRLFDDVAPLTVTNFLNYANASTANGGNYNNTFFHRSFSNFIFQGGGYSFNESNGVFADPGGIEKVISDGAIINEFGLSNTRGTIAMAKKGAAYTDASGNPSTCTIEGPDCLLVDGTGVNSATSQWFVNLSDNSANLDNQNGGFTVFGKVLLEGLPVIDEIASVQIYDFNEVFGFRRLPLIGYEVSKPVLNSNLIKVVSMNELFKISDDIDFGAADIGTVTDETITIQTAVDKELLIGEINNIKQLSAPFSIVQNDCKDTLIVSNASCDLVVRYAPTQTNDITDEFNIELTESSLSYTFRVRASNAPDISLSRTTGDFGFLPPYDPTAGIAKVQVNTVIENLGVKDLEIFSHELTIPSGSGSAFELIDNCQNTTIAPKSSPPGSLTACAMPVNFIGTTFGDFSFILTVISNDPNEPRIDIPYTVSVANDSDGVADAVEDSSANNGDDNLDNILDSRQSNVVSMPNALGDYISLVTFESVEFTDATFEAIENFRVPYAGANLEDGVLFYKINNLPAGAALRVGLFVPQRLKYSDYKLLTVDTVTNSETWSSSVSAGPGGVQVLRGAEITKPDGTIITRDLVSFTLIDGGYGDADLTENGIIEVAGLLLLQKDVKSASGGSGALDKLFLIVLLFLIVYFRNINTPIIRK